MLLSLIEIEELLKEAAAYSNEEEQVKATIKDQIKTTINPAHLLLLVNKNSLSSAPVNNHAEILKLLKSLTELQRKYFLYKISNNNSQTILTATKNPSTLV